MKKTVLLLVLFLSLLAGKSMAQVTDMPDVTATYVVSNNLMEKSFTEIWTYHPMPSPEDPNAYTLKKQPVPKEIRVEEIKSYWHKLIILTGQKSRHLKEHFWKDPAEMEGGEESYGYIEVWDMENKRVLESWPAFVQVKDLDKEIQQANFQIYIPEGSILTIVKIYDSRYYPLPYMENHRLTKNGVLKEDVTFTLGK